MWSGRPAETPNAPQKGPEGAPGRLKGASKQPRGRLKKALGAPQGRLKGASKKPRGRLEKALGALQGRLKGASKRPRGRLKGASEAP